MNISYRTKLLAISLLVILPTACRNPQPGPDKTIGGAVMGAAWGAGSGAVIGHQVEEFSRTGEGLAIGAGFGFAAGAATGLGYDQIEETQIKHEQELEALKVQNATNRQEIAYIQHRLDNTPRTPVTSNVYQVFFDEDGTSMRAGSVANLEVLADSIKKTPAARIVNVVGHTDDTGDPEHNKRLAEARARSVSAYLASRGVSMDQIRVTSYGSERPIASNNTAEGRQMNRRVDVYISSN